MSFVAYSKTSPCLRHSVVTYFRTFHLSSIERRRDSKGRYNSLSPGGSDILRDPASLAGGKPGINLAKRSSSSLDKSPISTTTPKKLNRRAQGAIRSAGLDTRDSDKITFAEPASYGQPTILLKTPRASAGKDSSVPLHRRRRKGTTTVLVHDFGHHGAALRLQKKTKTSQSHSRIPRPTSVSTGSDIELTIAQMLHPHPDTHRDRLSTLNRAQQAIKRNYGSKYKIELFGSVRYGITLPRSDLDMTIIDPDRPHGVSPGGRDGTPGIYNVRFNRNVARALQNAGFKNISTIPWASVPIVKFKDPGTGLECDINVNERLGIFNSEMIKVYCNLSSDLRCMLAFIKIWSKPLGLNTPSPQAGGGPASFSSYALALMTIGFLQKRHLLPNLQANLPPLSCGAKEGYVWVNRPRELCDVRFQVPADWKAPVKSSLSVLMGQWFKFWYSDFDYQQEALCIRSGGSTNRPLPSSSSICVLDPYIRSKNVTRNIHPNILVQFLRECEQAFRVLDDGRTLSALIAPRRLQDSPGRRCTAGPR